MRCSSKSKLIKWGGFLITFYCSVFLSLLFFNEIFKRFVAVSRTEAYAFDIPFEFYFPYAAIIAGCLFAIYSMLKFFVKRLTPKKRYLLSFASTLILYIIGYGPFLGDSRLLEPAVLRGDLVLIVSAIALAGLNNYFFFNREDIIEKDMDLPID